MQFGRRSRHRRSLRAPPSRLLRSRCRRSAHMAPPSNRRARTRQRLRTARSSGSSLFATRAPRAGIAASRARRPRSRFRMVPASPCSRRSTSRPARSWFVVHFRARADSAPTRSSCCRASMAAARSRISALAVVTVAEPLASRHATRLDRFRAPALRACRRTCARARRGGPSVDARCGEGGRLHRRRPRRQRSRRRALRHRRPRAPPRRQRRRRAPRSHHV